MHVRAYNYWVSLLDGRDFPSIEDLEPGDVEDFAATAFCSISLAAATIRRSPISAGDPRRMRADDDMRSIADVPSRSLLSRLTDHYMQIIANRAPIGFEAEFVNQRGDNICYRGILMPFSSDGEDHRFHLRRDQLEGADEDLERRSRWPRNCPTALCAARSGRAGAGAASRPVAGNPGDRRWHRPTRHRTSPGRTARLPTRHVSAAPAVSSTRMPGSPTASPSPARAPTRSRAAKDGPEPRSTSALALAYDFAVAAEADPQDYADLLEESGVKAQPARR